MNSYCSSSKATGNLINNKLKENLRLYFDKFSKIVTLCYQEETESLYLLYFVEIEGVCDVEHKFQ